MHWLLEPFYPYIYDFGWRDLIEIIFFSTIVYVLQCWLRHDTQKPLLSYWYTYCGIWLGAYLLELSTITYVLLFTLPATITMFVLIHQRTLQKNYLVLRAIRSHLPSADNWLDILIQTALITINTNKPFWAVIEHQDALDTMLATPLPLHATLKKELLVMLLDTVHDQTYIWVTTQGLIRGVNATWSSPADVAHTPINRPTWQQDALFFTALTDAIAVHADCTTRAFTVIAKGTIIEKMTAHNAQQYIQHYYLSRPTVSNNKGETIHGSYRTHTDHKQQPLS